MARLHLPLPPRGAPSEAHVTGERLHYLVRVLRLGPGDTLELFDGTGRAFPARVVSVSDAAAVLALGAPTQAPAARPVWLVQGLPKADKLEWVLQKGTELQASGFVPVHTGRTVVKLGADKEPERRKRWQRIVEEAARQCGRSDVPPVEPLAPLLDAAARLAPTAQLLVLDEEERALRLSEAAALLSPTAPVAVVVGPEGGLSREEVAALTALGAQAVTLGRLILRTETAGLAALAVLRHLDGQLG